MYFTVLCVFPFVFGSSRLQLRSRQPWLFSLVFLLANNSSGLTAYFICNYKFVWLKTLQKFQCVHLKYIPSAMI